MIALYLGVGITIFLLVVGVAVECLRKRYYEEQDESVTSFDSNDDMQSSSMKDKSAKKQQRSKQGSDANRSGQQDRREQPPSRSGQGSGSRNVRKEGGTRDDYEYEEDIDEGKKGRDYCPCYDQIARSTETCCTFCLGGEDNDLEELEYQAYKRQKERKTRAGTGDDSGAMFDFDYFGDRGTTHYLQEQDYFM